MIDSPIFINGRYFYRLDRSEMCEYMINFIHKLKDLPEKYMMNSVLENFTILQIVSNRDTNETLLCIAFVFEVSVSDNGTQHHIYRLIKPNATSNHWRESHALYSVDQQQEDNSQDILDKEINVMLPVNSLLSLWKQIRSKKQTLDSQTTISITVSVSNLHFISNKNKSFSSFYCSHHKYFNIWWKIVPSFLFSLLLVLYHLFFCKLTNEW